MKHLLISAAMVASLAISAPVWAQPTPSSPPPGATAPAPAAPPVQSMNRMPAGGKATSERGMTGSATRAHRTINRMPVGGRATSGGNRY